MGNRQPILDKILRNMLQRGITAVRSGDTVLVSKTGGDDLIVSYTDKVLASPIGGVSDAASPFLGIGVASPGTLKIKGAAAETTIALMFDTSEALVLLAEVSGYANDIVIERGDNTTELARIGGHEHLLGLGA